MLKWVFLMSSKMGNTFFTSRNMIMIVYIPVVPHLLSNKGNLFTELSKVAK